ncbi:MAG: class II aldolase/adducin family protein [Clostridiales bacterium]|nr:class II aldolase/adducin family protein [Clostridiales bacterium]
MEHKIRTLVCKAGKKIVETGLASGTWGNVSARIDKNTMLITPSGRDYSDIKTEDIALVTINTLKSTGNMAPSSETPMHAAIYRTRPEINGVIHTHPQYGCTVAASRKEVPPILDDMAQLIGPGLKVADYAHPGSDKMVEGVLEAIEGRNACLLANHGVVCFGRTLDEAFTVNIILEKSCRTFIDSFAIGGAIPFSDEEAEALHKMYMETYSVTNQREKLRMSGITDPVL